MFEKVAMLFGHMIANDTAAKLLHPIGNAQFALQFDFAAVKGRTGRDFVIAVHGISRFY